MGYDVGVGKGQGSGVRDQGAVRHKDRRIKSQGLGGSRNDFFLIEGFRLGRIVRLAFFQSIYSVESASDQDSFSWSSDLNFGIFFS